MLSWCYVSCDCVWCRREAIQTQGHGLKFLILRRGCLLVIHLVANWHYLPKNAFISKLIYWQCSLLEQNTLWTKIATIQGLKTITSILLLAMIRKIMFGKKNCLGQDVELNTIQNHFNIWSFHPCLFAPKYDKNTLLLKRGRMCSLRALMKQTK